MFWISGVPISDFVFFELFVCSAILFFGAIDASTLVELKEVPIVVDEFYSDLIVPFKDVVSVSYVRSSLRFEEYSFSKELRG